MLVRAFLKVNEMNKYCFVEYLNNKKNEKKGKNINIKNGKYEIRKYSSILWMKDNEWLVKYVGIASVLSRNILKVVARVLRQYQ